MAQPAKDGVTIRTVREPELRAEPKTWAKTIHALHAHTVDQLMWGRRWLNQGFYDRIFAKMPDALEAAVAEKNGKVIAGAFNVASATRLYGRYWGCFEQHPFLHFNVCYYHSVGECIARKTQVFEGGAGGEHKLPRGFEPSITYAAHRCLDARLEASLRRHLAEETPAREASIARFREEAGVYKKVQEQT
jgi:predicted N-acyltransferase